jgi:MFS family permease
MEGKEKRGLADRPDGESQRELLLPAFILLFLSALFYTHQYFFRVLPGTMQEDLIKDFELNDFELGNVAACFFYAYLIVQPLSGIVIARTSNAIALLIASIAVLLGALVMSMASASLHLYISQLLLGVGGSFALIIALNAGRAAVSKKFYPLFSGGVVAVGASGAILGQAPLSYISEVWHWQEIVFCSALLEVVIIVNMLWMLALNRGRERSQKVVAKTYDSKPFLRDTLTDSNVWLLSAMGFFLCLPMASFVIVWLYPFISLELGKDTVFSRLAPTMAYGGYVVGSPIVGWLATSMPARKPQMLMAASAIGLVTSLLAIYTTEHSIIVVYGLLFLMGVSISCMTIIISLVRDWIPSERLPIALGIAMCALNLGGTLSLIAIGYILDLEKAIVTVPQLEAYHVALVFVPSSFAIAIVVAGLIQLRARRRHVALS